MLKAELASRHRRARQGLRQAGEGQETTGITGITEITGETVDVIVPVVLRVFDPQALIDGAVRFAAALTPDQSDSWFRCYTRTVFLFGNPKNLATRHRVHQRAGDNAIGWLGVVDRRELSQLRRLLRPVAGTLPPVSALPQVSATPPSPAAGTPPVGTTWSLWLAVRDLDVAQYLVHLHHTVTEAVLTGKVGPDDTINLRHVSDLHPSRLERPDCVYSRVHYSPDNKERLRLYALLSHAHC